MTRVGLPRQARSGRPICRRRHAVHACATVPRTYSTANNRAINSDNSVTFTTEAGYISKDGTTPWITNGAIYYTADGTTPSGSLGAPAANTTTKAVALTYDHESNNNSIAGNSMYWTVTVPLPTYTAINYKISLWNKANNEEKFADYNTSGTNNATFSF